MKQETSDLSVALAVTRELVEMHQFFVQWFNGHCPQDEELFQQSLRNHFADSFRLIFPGGELLTGSELFQRMYKGYNQSPGFAIQIRNIEVFPLDDEGHYVFATYEEWMKNSTNSNPPNNGRISTVLFEKAIHLPNELRWRHVHETWLPLEQMQADPFDF